MNKSAIFVGCLAACLIISAYVYADTINYKDGRTLKGIVVEDYKDRLVFSTVDGEVTVPKADIKELIYDNEEENFLKMAELARDRNDFGRAIYYYDMVLKLNPESKAAKDGSAYVQQYIYKKEEESKLDTVKQQEEIEKYGSVRIEEANKADKDKQLAKKLKDRLGLEIKEVKAFPYVRSVSKNSAAEAAGIRTGDVIVAVWGRLTGYVPIEEVMSEIVEKPAVETRFTIERTLEAKTEGASFSMELDGLTVKSIIDKSPAGLSGLAQNDIITAIDGKSTRYMPLKDAIKIFKASAGGIKLTIRREAIIWRKD